MNVSISNGSAGVCMNVSILNGCAGVQVKLFPSMINPFECVVQHFLLKSYAFHHHHVRTQALSLIELIMLVCVACAHSRPDSFYKP